MSRFFVDLVISKLDRSGRLSLSIGLQEGPSVIASCSQRVKIRQSDNSVSAEVTSANLSVSFYCRPTAITAFFF